MSIETGFPTAIDSTMLLAYKSCPRQFRNSYILRRKPKGEGIHLVAGGAFATGIERARREWYENGERDESIWLGRALADLYRAHTIPTEQIPERFYSKHNHRVAEALVMYCDRWPFRTDALQPIVFQGKYGIEFSFAIPLPIRHPDTNDPLLYAGRCDMLADFGGRGHFGVDEKTSSSLGPQWADSFRLRGQFMGYAWAAREHGIPLAGVIVRGIGFLAGETRFEETIVYTPGWRLDLWYAETLRYAQAMVECYERGEWLHNFGGACASYGGCSFTEACEARDDSRILAFDFDHNEWTPIRKQEMKVNE